ncbi:lytic transglycosylase domain-containing protein [Oceanicella actignis]|nr:lytic transglycosylase domain-containing protein [Oceanicella actignis]
MSMAARALFLAAAAMLGAARAFAAAALGGFAGAPAPAADPAALCESAAAQAAREFGVPLRVMRALTLIETGRTLNGRRRPWPWTVNMEGEGRWFPDREAALAYVRARHAEGARSYDVGCFQINRRWHGEAFESLEAMFDPTANARYAAQFIRTLHDESGSWETAAGWYHSRTPKHAERYRRAFNAALAALGPLEGGAPDAAPSAAPRPPVRLASLMPVSPLGGPSLAARALRGGGLLRPARPLFD